MAKLVNSTIDSINQTVKTFSYLEVQVLSLDKGKLVLALSEDYLYFHNFEIHFENIFSVSINSYFTIDTSQDFILHLDKEEEYNINVKYNIETGNSIFKINNNDKIPFFVAAKNILLLNQVVKYY